MAVLGMFTVCERQGSRYKCMDSHGRSRWIPRHQLVEFQEDAEIREGLPEQEVLIETGNDELYEYPALAKVIEVGDMIIIELRQGNDYEYKPARVSAVSENKFRARVFELRKGKWFENKRSKELMYPVERVFCNGFELDDGQIPETIRSLMNEYGVE